jgi:hypothetical protein
MLLELDSEIFLELGRDTFTQRSYMMIDENEGATDGYIDTNRGLKNSPRVLQQFIAAIGSEHLLLRWKVQVFVPATIHVTTGRRNRRALLRPNGFPNRLDVDTKAIGRNTFALLQMVRRTKQKIGMFGIEKAVPEFIDLFQSIVLVTEKARGDEIPQR